MNFGVGCCEQSTALEALSSTTVLSICWKIYSELLMFLRVEMISSGISKPLHFYLEVCLELMCYSCSVNNVNSQSLILYCTFVIVWSYNIYMNLVLKLKPTRIEWCTALLDRWTDHTCCMEWACGWRQKGSGEGRNSYNLSTYNSWHHSKSMWVLCLLKTEMPTMCLHVFLHACHYRVKITL